MNHRHMHTTHGCTQDGDEAKTSDTETTKNSETSSTPIEDNVKQIVAIDVKWYFNFLQTLEKIQDCYAFTVRSIRLGLPNSND